MTEQEIREGNEIIKVFDKRDMPENDGLYNYQEISPYNYHTSWDWLMPIVEKIATMKLKYHKNNETYNPYPTTFAMPDEEGNLMVRFYANSLFIAPTLIEATWRAVVDFIKWNNDR